MPAQVVAPVAKSTSLERRQSRDSLYAVSPHQTLESRPGIVLNLFTNTVVLQGNLSPTTTNHQKWVSRKIRETVPRRTGHSAVQKGRARHILDHWKQLSRMGNRPKFVDNWARASFWSRQHFQDVGTGLKFRTTLPLRTPGIALRQWLPCIRYPQQLWLDGRPSPVRRHWQKLPAHWYRFRRG